MTAQRASARTDASLSDSFLERHVGSSPQAIQEMLALLGQPSLESLSGAAVPPAIALGRPLEIEPPQPEHRALARLRGIAAKNQVFRSYIGTGYYGTVTPSVIQRNVLENPGYYTQYTPYQAEIAQGRLEALLSFQTMVSDLTALAIANASLLDEATAAAEAMSMCVAASRGRRRFFVSDDCHPQTIEVVRTRALAAGVELEVGACTRLREPRQDLCGALLQYPTTDGRIEDYSELVSRLHAGEALAVVATDLLGLTLIRPPGEFGADIAVGSSQRFGVPMGFGGPHAAFLSTREELKRLMPGRVVGISRDSEGKLALRLAIQTREQHIRRERATSNICTAQVLLAIVAAMYACYHGPTGLRRIAERIRSWTVTLGRALEALGYRVGPEPWFDTLKVLPGAEPQAALLARAGERHMNLRAYADGGIGVSLDETVGAEDVRDLLEVFAGSRPCPDVHAVGQDGALAFPEPLARRSSYLGHPVFNSYHSEHEMLRYLRRLESRDLSLTTSMIALGSCTMKLNPTSAMLPITWPAFANLHPFVSPEQSRGYAELVEDLERWLAEITGLDAVTLQPNSGAQGEYTGLLAVRGFHAAHGQQRDVCLIPVSAHGTNPASAVMAGMNVVTVACDKKGNVDIADLRAKAEAHSSSLAALMLTYPSTHGVFESSVREICDIVHEFGGLVYLDGANMNAQVGLCRPGDYGADVCHLNLHKTFAMPHGGGGPGVGAVAVARGLEAFLPSHPNDFRARPGIGPVAAAPLGSAGILPIAWMYVAMMGSAGLKRASQVAILNANYMARRLSGHYSVVYLGDSGHCAHEFIIDTRPFKRSAGVEVEDIAKRLMDYGFHAPTMSFPVPGTLMIEPTESESKAELDRFCDAMIAIREEIRELEEGRGNAADSVLRGAPHTAECVTADEWKRPYARQQAAFPAPWTREHKYWPAVGRIDNAGGDRHLVAVWPAPEKAPEAGGHELPTR
ncbi:MAG: aminomethyl-transferring glycine dehydrogenase [Polyangiaceae bacterium]|nr:aminomethyl-transferring glycine dehydrogenase [Polyangiaceae bacterium]